MKKNSLLVVCSWLVCGAVLTSTGFSQGKVAVPVTKATASQTLNPSDVFFGDEMDEQALLVTLGIDQQQADLEEGMLLVALNDELTNDAFLAYENNTVAPVAATGGLLIGPSPIRRKNRLGNWQNVGSIDMVDILDATWGLGSGTLEQQVREYLQNARAEYHRFRLNGFYNISIQLADASMAIGSVQVSGDKRHMYLTYDIPGNQVSCTANLTSPFGWPDRDIRVTSTVRIEVTMDVTGNLAVPTSIRNFRLSLRDTECWNDGILFRETMNQRIEDQVNSLSSPIPTQLGQFLFSSVNTRIHSFVNQATTRVFFEYDSNINSVAFKLDSNTLTQPAAVLNTNSTMLSK